MCVCVLTFSCYIQYIQICILYQQSEDIFWEMQMCTCNMVTFIVECSKTWWSHVNWLVLRWKEFVFSSFFLESNITSIRKWKWFKATPLHLQHHLPAPTSVFPPFPSSTSWWCSRLSVKRGWVSHLSFRPLIVWHTAAQHGCQGLCRAWIRWPDYHPTRFHSPHTPALPWKQIACNLCGITCTFHNTQEKPRSELADLTFCLGCVPN